MFDWLYKVQKCVEDKGKNVVTSMVVSEGYLIVKGKFRYYHIGMNMGELYQEFSVFGEPNGTSLYDTETGEEVWCNSLVRFVNEQYRLRKFKEAVKDDNTVCPL